MGLAQPLEHYPPTAHSLRGVHNRRQVSSFSGGSGAPTNRSSAARSVKSASNHPDSTGWRARAATYAIRTYATPTRRRTTQTRDKARAGGPRREACHVPAGVGVQSTGIEGCGAPRRTAAAPPERCAPRRERRRDHDDGGGGLLRIYARVDARIVDAAHRARRDRIAKFSATARRAVARRPRGKHAALGVAVMLAEGGQQRIGISRHAQHRRRVTQPRTQRRATPLHIIGENREFFGRKREGDL